MMPNDQVAEDEVFWARVDQVEQEITAQAAVWEEEFYGAQDPDTVTSRGLVVSVRDAAVVAAKLLDQQERELYDEDDDDE